mmetsp:Transcript_15639/g.39966  ORF Transcript_15639/g.39966 Transcript_15639/m.39966 type:complete len:202 (-) Transcript_15639:656-1261(-)
MKVKCRSGCVLHILGTCSTSQCVASIVEAFASTLIQPQESVALLDHLGVIQKNLEKKVDLTGGQVDQVNSLIPVEGRVIRTEQWGTISVHPRTSTKGQTFFHIPARLETNTHLNFRLGLSTARSDTSESSRSKMDRQFITRSSLDVGILIDSQFRFFHNAQSRWELALIIWNRIGRSRADDTSGKSRRHGLSFFGIEYTFK